MQLVPLNHEALSAWQGPTPPKHTPPVCNNGFLLEICSLETQDGIMMTEVVLLKRPVAREYAPYHLCGFCHLVDKRVHKHQTYSIVDKRLLKQLVIMLIIG